MGWLRLSYIRKKVDIAPILTPSLKAPFEGSPHLLKHFMLRQHWVANNKKAEGPSIAGLK